jgi:hypothetical protein
MSLHQVALRKLPTPRAAILHLMLMSTLAFTAGARADEWVERLFDPPPGSRWIIQSDETSEVDMEGRVQTSVTKETSELTIEQKIADGFRVTYVVRNAVYESDERTAALLGPITKMLQNLVVRATTGLNGMPLRVENLDEVLAALRTGIDRAVLASKPEVAETLRQMATGMLIADDKRAPKIYLATLATLALGQNTGLRPGETRRDADDVANPVVDAPIKSNTLLRIDRADPATGNVRLIRTRAFDPDAIEEVLSKVARLGGGKDPQWLDNFRKQFTIAIDSRTEIDVEEGMTRAVRTEDTATNSVPGHRMVKHAHRQITVTRAP